MKFNKDRLQIGEGLKRYFYITIHFSPNYEGTLLSMQANGLYKNVETGELYQKRLLYDFGWGQENGFELLPHLSFNELIKLVEQPMALPQKKLFKKYSEEEIRQADIQRSNLYGAIAVIMQDYTDEFVDFLSTKVDTDYFCNSNIQENFKWFSFDSQKMKAEGKIPGGILSRSYESILSEHPRWAPIASKIIEQVYG